MSESIWVDGEWRPSADASAKTFRAVSPATRKSLDPAFPVSGWEDIDRVLESATDAFEALVDGEVETRAVFLEAYAEGIEADADAISQAAEEETGLPVRPRLEQVELPRTTDQLRQAAAAARDGSWSLPTIDTRTGIRSYHAPLGPVAVFGPNNFPIAFNAVSGGDFAAAIAAGNPVIAKAHPSHPRTTQLLARAASRAAEASRLPAGVVQLLYHFEAEDGLRMVSDSRIAAIGFTGSRASGLALKQACDLAGKPAYLEMSSINPVVLLPGALAERGPEIVSEYVQSALLGTGQFCTQPGLVFLIDGPLTESFIESVATEFSAQAAGLLLDEATRDNLGHQVWALQEAGARILTGGHPEEDDGIRYQNTLLRTAGRDFVERPEELQREAFGNASLIVVCQGVGEIVEVIERLEGNLTGSVYSSRAGDDDEAYAHVATRLRRKVGRLLDDKMPTGVAVTSAMHHGGPFPATGHPGFTSVGIPASLRRFTMLQCFDNVREGRLPAVLRNPNPGGTAWRWIDGECTRADIALPDA